MSKRKENPQKAGRKPGLDARFAREHGITRISLQRMGGVARLAVMSPEAANLMLSLAKRKRA